MKKLLVVGPSGAGKTTLVGEVASALKVPARAADQVYVLALEKLHIEKNKDKIFNPQYWSSPEYFGIESFGERGFAGLKENLYSKLLSGIGDGSFIIEGSSLEYDEERDILDRLCSSHETIVLVYNPLFEVWAERHFKRRADPNVFGWEYRYSKIKAKVVPREWERVVEFSSHEEARDFMLEALS